MKRICLELIVIFMIGAALIFFEYQTIPFGFDYDEVGFARLALSLDGQPYIPYSSLATGHSTLYFYALLIFFKIFGVVKLALRLPSAIFGLLNLAMFYFIMRFVLKKYAFLLTLVLATLRWYFSFARFSYEATFLLFWELVVIYFLLRFFKSRSFRDLVFTALFSAFAFNSYTPGRIFFVLPLVFLILLYLKKQIPFNRISLFLGIFFVMVLPLIAYLLAYSDQRFNDQFFFQNPKLSVKEKMKFFYDGAKSTVLMFHLRGDFNGRHNYPGKPAVNPILGLFFLAGLYIAIKNYKKLDNQIFIGFFTIALLPTLFAYPHESPHMLRTFSVIPSLIYFIGLTVKTLDKFIVKYKRYFLLAICCLFFVSAFYEIHTYFSYQRYVTLDAFELFGDLKTLVKTSYARP